MGITNVFSHTYLGSLIFAIQQRVHVLSDLEHREPQRTVQFESGRREPHERRIGVRGKYYDSRVHMGQNLSAVRVALGTAARRGRVLFHVLVERYACLTGQPHAFPYDVLRVEVILLKYTIIKYNIVCNVFVGSLESREEKQNGFHIM